MNLDVSEHIGNVLIAAVLTVVFGLLAATVTWVGFSVSSNAAPPAPPMFLVTVVE